MAIQLPRRCIAEAEDSTIRLTLGCNCELLITGKTHSFMQLG